MRARLAFVLVAGLSACGGNDGSHARDAAADASMFRFDAGDNPCSSDSECGDGIACTIDHCREGVCFHDPCADCCDTGLVCQTGVGCAAAPTACTRDDECADTVRCTLDVCKDARFCEHQPQAALCPAGQICLAAAGCIPRPPDHCTTEADCAIPGRPCLARWSCQPEFGCQFVSTLDCDDDDDCTVDACDDASGGCTHTPRDQDMDGHGDATCGGDDCDDADATRHPGATELCNGIDDDCDGHETGTCCVAGMPCTTSCGSDGTRACNPDGTEGACTPPAETCNRRDDDCDGMTDEGFDCMPGAMSSCTTTCGSAGTQTCTDMCTMSACAPPAEACNGMDDDCDGTADDGFACLLGTAMPCSTTCGSTGMRACLPGCTLDSCVPPAETCNGVDDDCDTACDDGFTCCAGAMRDCTMFGFPRGTAVCRPDCSGWDTTTCATCGNGMLDTGEPCDGTNLNGQTCTSIGMGFDGGTLRCTSGCVFDTSGCTRTTCGNGRIDSGEQCDGSALGGLSCTTIPGGYTGGTLRCAPTCVFDTSSCMRMTGGMCGNGIIESPEQCDGSNLAGQMCTSVPGGYTGGMLRCSASCTFDTGMCTGPMCGNNVREGTELCDGTDIGSSTCTSIGMGFTGGTLRCAAGCTSWNTSMCTMWSATGTYVVTSGTGTTYMCAEFLGTYAVNMSFGSMTFTQGGTSLSVGFSGLNCGNMTGTIDTMSRTFSVTCTIPGTCQENYSLTGSFSDDNHWSGTLSASYVGGSFACLDCTNHNWSVSGTR